MRPCVIRVAMALTLGVLVLQPGCQSGGQGAEFLSLFGLSEKPVAIALVAEPGVLDPFTPQEPLRKAMSDALKRPVQLRLALPIQLTPNLDLGFYQFACLTPAEYATLSGRDRFAPIAVSIDASGEAARSAVLVVRADSAIQSIEDLRGKTVAFGPAEDARTNLAGLALLRDQGLKKTDLSLELLPVPGSLKQFASGRDVAQTVQNQSSDAGFIDEAVFDALPETSDDEGEPARAKLRVIGRTIALPDQIVVRSPKVDDGTVEQVADFLLSADKQCPDALHSLSLSAFREPNKEIISACKSLVK